MYVSVLGNSDTAGGWRPDKSRGGMLLGVPDGRAIVTGLCMPHSPRIHRGDLWLLNSGLGQLLKINVEQSGAEVAATFPGYTRGLSMHGKYAFIGLSKIRETAVFGEIPLSDYHSELRCGVAIVDLSTGETKAAFQFLTGVDEIFDVAVVPQAKAVAIAGPSPAEERQTIWVVPTQDGSESVR